MAASSSSRHPKHKDDALSGVEPQGIRRMVSESTRLYDVFINHRGPDSKETLALPLYCSLKELGIQAFLDMEEMELGQSFPSTIETAICSAAVHIAIFSKRYAESPWCLAELLLMRQSQAKIIPVFYGVEPLTLRYIEKGVYHDAFLEYEKKFRYLEKLKEWKEALQSTSFTAGHVIKKLNNSDLESIVSAVQREFQRTKLLQVAKYPVGLDKLVQEFEIQCGMSQEEEGKAKIVGIFGMGGIGKTTLSKELYNRKRQQFSRACFLFDVRKASANSNLSRLQTKLLGDLFGENEISFESTEEGSSYISNRIGRSRTLSFLIILDDIDNVEQLDALSIMHMLKKPGNSLIIITTRDVGILTAVDIKIGYHLKAMNTDDARELFSLYAFSRSHPPSGYKDLVDKFVGVCGGLPLSLQVLGRHVHGRDESYWKSELKRAPDAMHRDIQKKLKISVDALNKEEKQIFMDVACFFVDQLKRTAIRVWEASGWYAQNGLQTLKDKCLVEELENPLPVLRMHDHLRDLGREMANKLNHPLRIWRPQDLENMESKGLENIFSKSKGRCFHSIFNKDLNIAVQFFLRESDDGPEMSSSLVWLRIWYPYSVSTDHPSRQQPLNTTVQQRIPSWIPLQNVQSLSISNGYFKRLWHEQLEVPSKLKELEIYGTFLEEFPDFLEILTDAEKEVSNGQQISKRKLLRPKASRGVSGSLSMNGDQKPAIVKEPLSFVEELVIREQLNIIRIVINGNYCPRIQSFELSCMKNLTEVQLKSVETLKCLKISKCEHLQGLSATSDLPHLEELSISACPELHEPCLGHLSCLKKMAIADFNFKSVPCIFMSSRMLVELDISRCRKLNELCLAHLCCLKRVKIEDCDDLKSVTGISQLQNLVELSISWCWTLELELRLVGLNCLRRITVDSSVRVNGFELNRCANLETVSGMSFRITREVSIRDCPKFRELPVICGASCLGGITINGCGKLNSIILADCRILKRVHGDFDPVGLSISNCPMLERLPCFWHVKYLEEICILQCGNLRNMSLPTTLKCLELNACRELEEIVGTSSPKKLVKLNISECPNLEIDVTDFIHLESLAITNVKSVSGASNLTKLVELEIRECLEFDMELSLSGSRYLKRIDIVQCGKMRKMALPTSLTALSLEACRDLEIVEGFSGLTNFEELNIIKCQFELQLSGLNHLKRMTIVECHNVCNIALPNTVIKLSVQRCRNFETVAGLCSLTQLTDLYISMCPELNELPGLCGLSCLESIAIDGCGKLNRLHVTDCLILKGLVGISDLSHLAQLWISDCPELEELPSLARLTCLEDIRIFRCGKIREISWPETLKILHLSSCKELKCVSGISHLRDLVELIVSECSRLELLLNLEGMNSLQSIRVDGCAKLKSFMLKDCQNLKSVSGIFDVASLSMCYCPELEELPSLLQLNCLKRIIIDSCYKLDSLIVPITLTELRMRHCRKFRRVAGLGDHHSKLEELSLFDCPELEELPSFATMSCLKVITIDSCEMLHSLVLPTTLTQLRVHLCRKFQTVAGMDYHTKLIELCECPEIEELPSFARCSSLNRISIDSCEKLRSVILPTTLRVLTVQRCKKLHTLAGMGGLTMVTELHISECPELEVSPVLHDLSCVKCITVNGCGKLNRLQLTDCTFLKGVSGTQFCISDCVELEEICVSRCENLQRITMSTVVKNLHLDDCPDLRSVSDISNLKNLVHLIVFNCPQLVLGLNVEAMNSLQNIQIHRCLTLNNVVFNKCQKLRILSLSCSYFNDQSLSVTDCPELEFLSLGESYGVSIFIYSCEKLEIIEGMEESQALKLMQLLYRSNASIRCIPMWRKSISSAYIQIIGRAADGAEFILSQSMFSEASFCTGEMQALFELEGHASTIIICAVVEVNSSVHPFPQGFVAKGFQLQEGELIITTVITDQFGKMLNKLSEEFCRFWNPTMKKCFAGAVKIGEEWRTLNILHTIIDKLHQK